MAETKEWNMVWGTLHPNILRAVRDQIGNRVWLHPAQLAAYVDMGFAGKEMLAEHTVAGFPCFVDPTFPKDRIDFIDGEGKVVSRIVNLAVPAVY